MKHLLKLYKPGASSSCKESGLQFPIAQKKRLKFQVHQLMSGFVDWGKEIVVLPPALCMLSIYCKDSAICSWFGLNISGTSFLSKRKYYFLNNWIFLKMCVPKDGIANEDSKTALHSSKTLFDYLNKMFQELSGTWFAFDTDRTSLDIKHTNFWNVLCPLACSEVNVFKEIFTYCLF